MAWPLQHQPRVRAEAAGDAPAESNGITRPRKELAALAARPWKGTAAGEKASLQRDRRRE